MIFAHSSYFSFPHLPLSWFNLILDIKLKYNSLKRMKTCSCLIRCDAFKPFEIAIAFAVTFPGDSMWQLRLIKNQRVAEVQAVPPESAIPHLCYDLSDWNGVCLLWTLLHLKSDANQQTTKTQRRGIERQGSLFVCSRRRRDRDQTWILNCFSPTLSFFTVCYWSRKVVFCNLFFFFINCAFSFVVATPCWVLLCLQSVVQCLHLSYLEDSFGKRRDQKRRGGPYRFEGRRQTFWILLHCLIIRWPRQNRLLPKKCWWCWIIKDLTFSISLYSMSVRNLGKEKLLNYKHFQSLIL